MIMKRILPLCVAAIGTLSMVSFATASQPLDYVVLKGGIYSPSSNHHLSNFNAGVSTHLDSKTGFSGEIAFGHYFAPIFAVELGIGYFESKGNAAAQPGELKLQVVPVSATGKLLFPLGQFEPYGLAGIAAYITDAEVSGNSSDFNGSTEITYGLHLGAGFNFNLPENMFVGLEGKYLWAEPEFGGQHIDLDGFITTVHVGFRF
ncbi:porin family protein [Chrysiogenes arsenatis]|uniref:porin family protein n=1 Tax=Chrysiogenes arsenatis TaxID=309797 RepID=UPI000418B248|nr:porin family protein [Chrysiogenes arsenatis]